MPRVSFVDCQVKSSQGLFSKQRQKYNGQNPSIVGDQETSSNSIFVIVLNLKDKYIVHTGL